MSRLITNALPPQTWVNPPTGFPKVCPDVCQGSTDPVMSITVYQMTVYAGLPGSIAPGFDPSPRDAVIVEAGEWCMDQYGCSRNCPRDPLDRRYITGYFRGHIPALKEPLPDQYWAIFVPRLMGQGANAPGTITMLPRVDDLLDAILTQLAE